MMPSKGSRLKTLCGCCGKSYIDMRRHLKGAAHRRKLAQTAMPFAQSTAPGA